jgi:hypothetical protein
MSAHLVLMDIHKANANFQLTDPGNAGTIGGVKGVDRSPAFCGIISAGAETRTLPRPVVAGDELTIATQTAVGPITLTVTGGYDTIGSTTLVLGSAGLVLRFVSIQSGATLQWRLLSVTNGTLLVSQPYAKITTGTAAVLTAGDASGAAVVHYINNASNATVTLRTATQMFGDILGAQVGFAYTLLIRNLNATTLTLTAPDANTTLSGTMTIAQNTTRTFEVVFNSATTMTITSMGVGAAAA